MIWYLVYLVNDSTDNEWYEMMSEATLENAFYDRGEYYQSIENPATTMQIVGQSRNVATIASKLMEKREE